MPILEDDVKKAMATWLEEKGYQNVIARLSTRQGYDVEGIDPDSKRLLVIECKGEAGSGSQHARSWPNVASAILTSLNEIEDPDLDTDVAMAFPDTEEYRHRMRFLKNFCNRQNIDVYWVSEDNTVRKW